MEVDWRVNDLEPCLAKVRDLVVSLTAGGGAGRRRAWGTRQRYKVILRRQAGEMERRHTIFTNRVMTLTRPVNHTDWTLQVQTNGLNVGISTNWVTVPGSTLRNSYTNNIDPNTEGRGTRRGCARAVRWLDRERRQRAGALQDATRTPRGQNISWGVMMGCVISFL